MTTGRFDKSDVFELAERAKRLEERRVTSRVQWVVNDCERA